MFPSTNIDKNEHYFFLDHERGPRVDRAVMLFFAAVGLVCVGAICFNIYILTSTEFGSPSSHSQLQMPKNELRLGAVGDVLMEETLQIQAFASGSYKPLWESLIPLMKGHDIMYANHEGTQSYVRSIPNGTWDKVCDRLNATMPIRCYFVGNMTWTEVEDLSAPARYEPGGVFSSGGRRLLFNYHPMLSKDLQDSGVNIMSTANNHCLDRGPLGVVRTLQNLRAANISTVGTRERDNQRLFTIKKVNGITTAWVACTDSVNWALHARRDSESQVMDCFQRRFLSTVQHASKVFGVDIVIAAVHWGSIAPRSSPHHTGMARGIVYQREVDCMMANFSRLVLEAGATIVLGSHPHVLHRMEKYVTSTGRAGLIAYSLGNFISHGGYRETLPAPGFLNRGYSSELGLMYRRASVLITIGMKREFIPDGRVLGRVNISCVSYVPIYRRMSKINDAIQIFADEALPGSPEHEFVVSVMGDSGTFATNSKDQKCHDFSKMPEGNQTCKLPRTTRVRNSGGWVDEIPGQFCKCELLNASSGCQWCVYNPGHYCTGPPITKKSFGSRIPYDECLARIAKDPECGEFAYAGGGRSQCVCLKAGVTCEVEASASESTVYRTTCPPPMPNTKFPLCTERSPGAPCGYCLHAATSYCRGVVNKKELGRRLPRHICLAAAQNDPECGHYVYGPETGTCTCITSGQTCSLGESRTTSAVFVDTCKALPVLPSCSAITTSPSLSPSPSPSQEEDQGTNSTDLPPQQPRCQWCVAAEASYCGGSPTLRKDLQANLQLGMRECLAVAESDPECGEFAFGRAVVAGSTTGSYCRCVRKGAICDVKSSTATIYQRKCGSG